MRARTNRKNLSTESIADTALKLARELGLRALTSRAVAAELGAAVPDIDAIAGDRLRELAVDRMLATFRYQPQEFDGWRPDLLRFAEAYRAHLAGNLWAVPAIRLNFAPSTPGLAAIAETFFQIAGRGFAQPKRAARLLLTLLTFTHGWVLSISELAAGSAERNRDGPAPVGAANPLTAAGGFSQFPETAKHLVLLRAGGTVRDFRAGVEALIGTA